MGFFDFFRRKKEKPVEQKKESKLEPVKENRTDKPFEKERRDEVHRKGPRRNFKRKQKTANPKPDGRHAKSVPATTSRPAKKHYAINENTAVRNYTVKAGDSLSRIAKEFYGNANDWQKIYQANKGRIKDPNIIHPGQTLVIP
jgi:nucleoid-associated protein YgaU